MKNLFISFTCFFASFAWGQVVTYKPYCPLGAEELQQATAVDVLQTKYYLKAGAEDIFWNEICSTLKQANDLGLLDKLPMKLSNDQISPELAKKIVAGEFFPEFLGIYTIDSKITGEKLPLRGLFLEDGVYKSKDITSRETFSSECGRTCVQGGEKIVFFCGVALCSLRCMNTFYEIYKMPASAKKFDSMAHVEFQEEMIEDPETTLVINPDNHRKTGPTPTVTKTDTVRAAGGTTVINNITITNTGGSNPGVSGGPYTNTGVIGGYPVNYYSGIQQLPVYQYQQYPYQPQVVYTNGGGNGVGNYVVAGMTAGATNYLLNRAFGNNNGGVCYPQQQSCGVRSVVCQPRPLPGCNGGGGGGGPVYFSNPPF